MAFLSSFLMARGKGLGRPPVTVNVCMRYGTCGPEMSDNFKLCWNGLTGKLLSLNVECGVRERFLGNQFTLGKSAL